MCQWLPYATVLASKGYRVVAFDFAGFGASSPTKQKTYLDDIRTVVSYLRDRGTTRVVVVGASMGATMGVLAGAAITPPVDGVVALSSPLQFDGVNAERAAPSLKSPVLYVAGDDDGDYAVYARTLNQATPADMRGLLVVSAPQHGVQFVAADTPEAAQVRSAIEAFLAEHLQPVPSPHPRPVDRGSACAPAPHEARCWAYSVCDVRGHDRATHGLGCAGTVHPPSTPEGDRHRECRGCAGD
jgi:pimeloyl-ACP methyl ester carboxylesterase